MERLPPRLAAVLRPELPSLSDEIVAEICTAIPQYARAIRGEHGTAVRQAIEYTMRAFVDAITTPTASTYDRDELCRMLGRLQIGSETGLARLDSAIRIGVRVCWRRTVAVAERYEFPASVQSNMADLLFGYVEELTSLAIEGYCAARRGTVDDVARHRRQLVRDLLDGRPSEATLAHSARLAQWPLPARITAVALERAELVDETALPEQVLSGWSGGHAVLLVPDEPAEDGTIAALSVPGLPRRAIGPSVAPESVRHSVRWAVRALSLADRGVLCFDADGVLDASADLLTIWLSNDTALTRLIYERNLSRLADVTGQQRARMIETLYCWLVHHGNAVAMGDALGIHPQTVRYRMRGLELALGDLLDDPQWRISTELALRATRGAGGARAWRRRAERVV